MKSDIEVLDEAIELISAEGGFCKRAFARDAAGRVVMLPPPPKTRPVSFCLEGAIGHANGYFLLGLDTNDEVFRQWCRLNKLVGTHGMPRGVGHWNTPEQMMPREFNDKDHTSQEDAVQALKRTRHWLEEHGEE